MEVERDPAETMAAAVRYPAISYEETAVGLDVNGQVVYRAEDALLRARQAASGYKRGALMFGAAAVLWAGALAWWLRRDIRKTAEAIR